jgi:hypothetical protein
LASIESIELKESGMDQLLPLDDLQEDILEEHPLRTDEWELRFKGPQRRDPFQRLVNYAERTYDIGIDTPKKKGKRRARSSSTDDDGGVVVRFNTNGYCKLLQCSGLSETLDKNNVELFPHVGSWHTHHGCVLWSIPVWVSIHDPQQQRQPQQQQRKRTQDPHTESVTPSMHNLGDEEENQASSAAASSSMFKLTTLHFTAEVHVNKFGEQPRMFKGIVTRERFNTNLNANPNNRQQDRNSNNIHQNHNQYRQGLFGNVRPVVGTFAGSGIGVDTLDLEYKDRGLGLYDKPQDSTLPQ